LQEGHQVLEKTTTLLSLIVTSINSRFDIVFLRQQSRIKYRMSYRK
jgi:hypothetical protein